VTDPTSEARRRPTSINDAPADQPRTAHQPPITLEGEPPGPVAPTDTPAAAARKVIWIHAGRLLDRELEIDDPDRPDALRKYRVATRRLRSALRVFGFALPDAPSRRIRRELGDLADVVGTIRDADVRIADVAAFGARTEWGADAVGPLIEAWRAERERAHGRLLKRMATKRHRRFLERLAAFVEERPVPAAKRGQMRPTVRGHAAAHVWEAYEAVRAYAEIVRSADLVALHQLRIETKRCRYTLEFLADILGPESGWLIERLTALQDHLGALNDAALAAEAVRAFLERRGADLDPARLAASTAYLAEREGEAGRLRKAAGGPFRPVVSAAFVRRLGRTVAIA
jgi:CHAD domain-containing protein